jgi:pyruvate dehydrogenase E1 component beta subunit
MSAEVIATVAEHMAPGELRATPRRITLPDAPAPTSRVLEKIYYPDVNQVVRAAQEILSI